MNKILHTDIAAAQICQGINLVMGKTGTHIIPFVRSLCLANAHRHYPHNPEIQQYPEGHYSSKELRQWFETLPADKLTTRYIITRSIFVMREAHILQKKHGYPVRWFYVKDGGYMQADSMDYIGQCEALDEEVMQAERYINLENGLTPRNPAT